MARTFTLSMCALLFDGLVGVRSGTLPALGTGVLAATDIELQGRQLFDRETFGGNGRTCKTCHGTATGTVSPLEAQQRFAEDPTDPLFVGDGSDDGEGNGVTRMLADATIRMRVPMHADVALEGSQDRLATLFRGIPTTLDTPALDPVLMLDGRQPDLVAQALGAINDHARPTRVPTAEELQSIAAFERTSRFFSSKTLENFARTGVPPTLPMGRSPAEIRGRHFFEDLPATPQDPKAGLCATCHSGPMLNETNDFFVIPIDPLHPELGFIKFPPHMRFFSVGVSEFNAANNPVQRFLFRDPSNVSAPPTLVVSPDPGRALVTGHLADVNAFKISTLWNVAKTAPYFHDNSARTLEDMMRHYALFFRVVSQGTIVLTQQDQDDAIAFLKLLQ